VIIFLLLFCFTDDAHFVVVGQKLCSSLPLQNSLRVSTFFYCDICVASNKLYRDYCSSRYKSLLCLVAF